MNHDLNPFAIVRWAEINQEIEKRRTQLYELRRRAPGEADEPPTDDPPTVQDSASGPAGGQGDQGAVAGEEGRQTPQGVINP